MKIRLILFTMVLIFHTTTEQTAMHIATLNKFVKTVWVLKSFYCQLVDQSDEDEVS